ncbi:hypothetical protein GJ744_008020 [Endocarpon pusillum]|uniref:Uncharacterized protein n=1 Tax=Endocarpon pusillum TaxID=364733 RepID=A0A8H7E4V7_9EURO|nr:hypothetical protein GJ744_008020 [Endocarpon pusillum]
MCYQVIERYAVCRCLYYRHAIDPCQSYGQRHHHAHEKTVLTGYACPRHSTRRTYKAKSVIRTQDKAKPTVEDEKPDDRPGISKPIVEDEIPSRDEWAFTEIAYQPRSPSATNKAKTRNMRPSIETRSEALKRDTLTETESVTSSNTSRSLFDSQISQSSSLSAPVGRPGNFVDAAHELADVLYEDEVVGALLHLHFERGGPQFSGVLTRLLRQYSANLRKDALSQMEKAACQLVRFHAGLIVQTVQSRLGYPLQSLFDNRRKRLELLEDELAELRAVDSDSDEEIQQDCPTLSSIKEFLLEGRAFQKLRQNLQIWSPEIGEVDVGMNQFEGSSNNFDDVADGKVTGFMQTLMAVANFTAVTRVLNMLISPFRDSIPAPKQGRTRVRWQCSCGKAFYDDYKEEFPGAGKALDYHLNKKNNRSQQSRSQKSLVQSSSQLLSSLSASIKMMFGFSAKRNESLPLSTTAARGSTSITSAPPGRLLFLLTCLKLGTAPLLRQENVCEINSDRDFFHFLQSIRKNSRSRFYTLFAFSKVVQIRFVHFELFPNDLVNIISEDGPPADSGYMPVKESFATFPPIGSSILVHLYENPDHADLTKLLLGRIPKKLDSELQICQIKRLGIGWGLELVEGLDWGKTWFVGLVTLIVSYAFGILWSVLRHDVQGGWAVTACMMMFVPFLTGAIHSAYNRL